MGKRKPFPREELHPKFLYVNATEEFEGNDTFVSRAAEDKLDSHLCMDTPMTIGIYRLVKVRRVYKTTTIKDLKRAKIRRPT